MADESKEAFAELLDQVKALRAAGVKTATFDAGSLLSVEFFEPRAIPGFGTLDLDTIIPPAPQRAAPGEDDAPRRELSALERVFREGSIS